MAASSSPLRFRWQVLATLLAMACVVLYLAYLKGGFEHRLHLTFQTDSAVNLHPGMKVSFKGVEVGKVVDIQLSPQGAVLGQVEVRAQHAPFFTQGSRLKISKEKIVTAELVLQRDESQTTPMAEQSSIEIVREDLAADFTKRLDPLLQKFQVLMAQLADPQDGLQANLHQSRQVMEQTVKTLQQATHAVALMSDEQKGLPSVLVQTRDTMQALQPTASQATATLKELEKSLAQTSKALDAADKLIQNLDATVQDVQAAPVYRWLVPSRSQEAQQKAPQ